MKKALRTLCFAMLATLATGLAVATDAKPIDFVETDKPYVALTFDDGPDPTVFPKLLDLFKAEGVRVTFYLVGNNAARHPELVKRMLAEGHEIGNHSMSHADLGKLEAEDEVRKEIVDTHKLLEELGGKRPATFRAPYLSNGGHVLAVLTSEKLPAIDARVDSRDWDSNVSADEIYEKTIGNAAAGDIVLCHSWREATLEVMPRILAFYREKGLTPVTVSELLAAGKAGTNADDTE